MRNKLKSIEGLCMRFRAKVEKYGFRTNYNGYPQRTILCTDVTYADTNEFVTDHIWLICEKKIYSLKLKEGDCIEFDAKVAEYEKLNKALIDYGIREFVRDYNLENPNKIIKL